MDRDPSVPRNTLVEAVEAAHAENVDLDNHNRGDSPTPGYNRDDVVVEALLLLSAPLPQLRLGASRLVEL